MKYSFRNLYLFNTTLISILFFISNNIFPQNVGETYRLNINSINLPLNNRGVIADVDVPPFGSSGIFEESSFLFSSGFLLSGYDDSLWANGVGSFGLIEDYVPGTIHIGSSDPRSALYKLRADDPAFGQSWQDWIDAVELGADFYDGDGDGLYYPVDLNGNNIWDPNEDKPDILGDESIWCVYNDSLPLNLRRYNSEPKGIEIRQTVFAFESSVTPLSNVIFIRYKIKNTGSVNNFFSDNIFSVYADPDLGDHTDDIIQCDTINEASYVYNDSTDQQYGSNPPVFLMDILSGPVKYIPGETFIDNNGNNVYENGIDTPLDTAYIRRGEIGVQVFIGATNLRMSSAITSFKNEGLSHDPDNIEEARFNMLGLSMVGDTVDPCTWQYGEVFGGINCAEVNPIYWFSGDPVDEIGWINTTSQDERSITNVGQFDLPAGKTKEVMVAYIIGRGNDPLNSIEVARDYSDEIQLFYENNFGYPIILSTDNQDDKLNNFSLEQNYPNPFNPTTKIKYTIPNVIASETKQSHLVTIKVYDILGNEIATLVNEEKPAGEYEVEFDGSGLPSGIYFYRLQAASFVKTHKMILLK
jgi:hypothetical protein